MTFCTHKLKEPILLNALLPKAIYTFTTLSIKIQMAFFTKKKKIVLQYVGNHKNVHISNLEKEEQTQRYHVCVS